MSIDVGNQADWLAGERYLAVGAWLLAETYRAGYSSAAATHASDVSEMCPLQGDPKRATFYAAGSRNLVATASVTAPDASPRLCTTIIGRLARENP